LDFYLKNKTHNFYHQIKKMNRWDDAAVSNWQNGKIQELITHFYNNTAYYKNLLDTINIDPKDIKTKEDLKKIPIITKRIIHENYEDLIPKNLRTIPHKNAATGGSSGDPLKYLLDLDSWSFTTAAKIYAWQTTGYLYGDRFATLGSTSLFPEKSSLKHTFYHMFKNSIRLNAVNLSEEVLESYIKILVDKKVKYIYGYAAALFLLARHINKNNIRLLDMEGCFPTSEVLTDEYRSEMKKSFGFVMDGYGARDGGINAYEINEGVYNVGYNSYVEILGDNKQGPIIVTDLLNKAFPFIRYELGDEVTMGNQFESVYNGQIIKNIIGRTPDIIRLDNGHTLTGAGFTVMFSRFNVKEYRISKQNNLSILVEIISNDLFKKEEENLIISTMKRHAGEDCNIVLKHVKVFERKSNGKVDSFLS
jgi:phenylacetate-CoA ligase